MSFTDEAIQIAISWATSELGYSALRHFLRGSDVFVSLPTGSGKSLCYCLLPSAFDFLWQQTALRESIVIVVSPLISLMQDQLRAMIERNFTAVYIEGADDMLEAEICAGNYQLVYCSPESLLTDNRWRGMLQSPSSLC